MTVIAGSEDEVQLHEGSFYDTLVFPDGDTLQATTAKEGGCIVALDKDGSFLAVFIDGELSFTLRDYIKPLSPLARSLAISDAGYLAFHTGAHQEQVFNLRRWDGEVLLQRIVEVARTPSFTPNGEYTAFWRLTDKTIYCYDTESAVDSGSFDSTDLRDSNDVGRAVNIGVNGTEYQGAPAFEIRDTYGGEDELLAYLSPDGRLLKSLV